MTVRPLAVAVAAGYALGTVPVADVVARRASQGTTDLRRAGTGNPGAVNAMAVLGKRWGYAILAGDIAKGVAASRLGHRLAGDAGAHLGGAAAVVGHCYPVWNRFRGGKGVAASCGQCLATFPAYFPLDLLVAWAGARWRQRTMPATAMASAVWVTAGVVWWRRGWPNAWGPAPSKWLPIGAAVSSVAIMSRFIVSRRGVQATQAGPHPPR